MAEHKSRPLPSRNFLVCQLFGFGVLGIIGLSIALSSNGSVVVWVAVAVSALIVADVVIRLSRRRYRADADMSIEETA